MRNETVYGNGLFSVIKATATALALSLLLAVLFAVVLRSATVPSGVIYPVNQILKNIALVAGVLSFVRGEKGWLKGMAVGFLVVAVTYLLFGLISSSLEFGLMTLVEALFGVAVGLLCGIISVNLKK